MVEKKEELPESANFAFQQLNFLVSQSEEETVSKKTKEAIAEAKWINKKFSHAETSQKTDIRKAIAMFGEGLPLVPLFDCLRESLIALYIFADRYLHKDSSSYGPKFGEKHSPS